MKRPYTEKTKNLTRSHNYRDMYFAHNKGITIPKTPIKGLYFCPYCGKPLWNKQKIVIDHIYAIRRVQYTKHLREHFKSLHDGVNDISNLVACCRRCNGRKGKKGGAWVFLAHYGVYFMPFVRLLAALCIMVSAALAIHVILSIEQYGCYCCHGK